MPSHTSPPEASAFSSVKQTTQRTGITGLSEEQMLFQISLNRKCIQISEISKYVCGGVTCILKSMRKQCIKQQACHTAEQLHCQVATAVPRHKDCPGSTQQVWDPEDPLSSAPLASHYLSLCCCLAGSPEAFLGTAKGQGHSPRRSVNSIFHLHGSHPTSPSSSCQNQGLDATDEEGGRGGLSLQGMMCV